jgi:uncharacterized protein (DUF2235 family)
VLKKRIIICCDGTWNEPEKLSEERIVPTNVLLMVRAIRPHAGDKVDQVVFYETGLGTGALGKFNRVVAGATGLGISGHIQSCYRFLANNYKPGDEIFLFGFSRGAYTARSLVGMIGAVGLLEKADMEFLPEAYHYYRTEPSKRRGSKNYSLIERIRGEVPPIKFIGVWDTVGALGAPTPLLRKLSGRFWAGFHDTELSDIVENAVHAVAIDERRGPFRPSLWTAANKQTKIEQVWFCGVHSNVGGGYPDAGLSDVALDWMLDRATECGLCIDEQCRKDKIKPDALGHMEDSYSAGYRFLELFRVKPYLRPLGLPDTVNEKIHYSVLERLRHRTDYRPPNLVDGGTPLSELMDHRGQQLTLRVGGVDIPVLQPGSGEPVTPETAAQFVSS